MPLKRKDDILAIGITCAPSTVAGDVVEIVDDFTGAKVSNLASTGILGTVVAHAEDEYGWDENNNHCTIETRFRCRRSDRVFAGTTPVGPFVFDANMKVIPYVGPKPAVVRGVTAGPYAFVTGTNDSFAVNKGTPGTGVDQAFTFTTETAINEVVETINTTAVGFIASATSDGKLMLTSTTLAGSLQIKAGTKDCTSDLGLTIAITAATARTHSAAGIAGIVLNAAKPASVASEDVPAEGWGVVADTNDKLSITIADGSAQIFTLPVDVDTSVAEVVALINDTATDFAAAPSGDSKSVVLTANALGDDITINTIAHSAYVTLGLKAGIYKAPLTVDTLEY